MNVCERFIKYVGFESASDEKSETTPSTASQLEIGRYLAAELEGMGLSDAHIDADGYVYAKLPATKGVSAPAIGFIAHMDTSPAVTGKDARPKIVEYNGGDIKLSDRVSIKTSDFPFLPDYIGQHLVVTDGTTLLGADDKAGIAEIFSAMEYFLAHPEIPHGDIYVAVTPDEEIGRGADKFDLNTFAAEFAYTIDGGALGEIEYENFNAASAKFKINGINIHPGTAKNKMKNATLIAAKLISMLPEAETPSHTEKYEGFYHVCELAGNESLVEMEMIIRDHDMQKFIARKQFVERLTDYLNAVYGESTVECEMRDSYYNMKEKILPVMHIVERAANAMKAAGVEPKIVPIRGGTDGARLSYEGLPCPNLSTGGENFHGIHEFVSVEAMEKMVEIIVKIGTAQ